MNVTEVDENARLCKANIEDALLQINGEQSKILNFLDIKLAPNRIVLPSM